jgi:hypothetical protein
MIDNDRNHDDFVELVAENMAIHAGSVSEEEFIPAARELIRQFEAIEGREPRDYLEIEEWSLSRLKSGKLLVLK